MCEMLLLKPRVAHAHFVPAAQMELHTPAAALGAKGVCRGIFSVLAALRKCQLFTHEQHLLGYWAYGQVSTAALSWECRSPGVYPCGTRVQGLCSPLCSVAPSESHLHSTCVLVPCTPSWTR